MDNKSSYIKTDNGKFINEKFIIWVKKMDDCLNVGTVETSAVFNTYKICKLNNPQINDKIKDLVS
jgi:hypothetical protein